MLTEKQNKLYKFLKEKIRKDNISPSFEEMKVAMGLKSKSGIQRLINSLVERGFIEKRNNRKRAINIIKDSSLNKIKKDQNILELPLLGNIAAGNPIEAINSTHETIKIPSNFVSSNKKNYILKVKGNSMKDKGIIDGDKAIIEYNEIADNGDIVVALINNEEVTLKTLKKLDNKIELIPANKNYKTNSYTPNEIKIQGKLKGIIRNY